MLAAGPVPDCGAGIGGLGGDSFAGENALRLSDCGLLYVNTDERFSFIYKKNTIRLSKMNLRVYTTREDGKRQLRLSEVQRKPDSPCPAPPAVSAGGAGQGAPAAGFLNRKPAARQSVFRKRFFTLHNVQPITAQSAASVRV